MYSPVKTSCGDVCVPTAFSRWGMELTQVREGRDWTWAHLCAICKQAPVSPGPVILPRQPESRLKAAGKKEPPGLASNGQKAARPQRPPGSRAPHRETSARLATHHDSCPSGHSTPEGCAAGVAHDRKGTARRSRARPNRANLLLLYLKV